MKSTVYFISMLFIAITIVSCDDDKTDTDNGTVCNAPAVQVSESKSALSIDVCANHCDSNYKETCEACEGVWVSPSFNPLRLGFCTFPNLDAGVDATLDTISDAGVDASEDATIDTLSDVISDASVDSSIDVSVDASVDVSFDSAIDVAIDVAVDAPMDTAADAGSFQALAPCATEGSYTMLPNDSRIDFGAGLSYSPMCTKIAAGSILTITASGFHPLVASTRGTTPNRITGTPAEPMTVDQSLFFPTPGFYPFYCNNHGNDNGSGMSGVLWVQ